MNQEGVYHLENTTSKLNVSTLQALNNIPSNMNNFNSLTSNEHKPKTQYLQALASAFPNSGRKQQNGPNMMQQKPECHNKPDSESRVKVVVRVRPPIAEDSSKSYEFMDCTCISKNKRSIHLKRLRYEEREFQFDHVLDKNSEQSEMYDIVARPIVDDILRGYNGTILAYGQTGTGKTFSIFGPGTHWELDSFKKNKQNSESAFVASEDGSLELHKLCGVIPRSVHHIFSHMIKIYMENIMDLLDSSKSNLQIREDPAMGIFVENLTQVVVQDPRDIIHLIKEGAQNRAISSTNMNKVSSRSHVILTITLEQRQFKECVEDANKKRDSVRRSAFTIVDLAGSERVLKSGSEGQRLEEAKKINKSLTALGKCVAALINESSTHVPFRDSKLTRLLTDSLGGNSKTCLIATIGPSLLSFDESYSTLLFATRAMAVKNHAVINEVVDFKVLSGNLQKKLSIIENEKFRLMARNVDLEREVSELKNEINDLKHNMLSNSTSMQYNNHGTSNITINNNLNESFRSNSEFSTHDVHYYEKREKELICKFTSVVQNLQTQIMKQCVNHSKADNDGDVAVEKIIDGILCVPSVKQKLIQKLLPDLLMGVCNELTSPNEPKEQITSPDHKTLNTNTCYVSSNPITENSFSQVDLE